MQGEGHYQVEDSTYVIDSDEEEEVFFYQKLCLMARKHGKDAMTSSMMVLDTGSSASVFHNQDLLERIGATSKTLRLMTNGG